MSGQDQDDLDPEQRVQDIKWLFRRISNTLHARIAATAEELSSSDAIAAAKKLSELETAHVALVKAEEAFHEKTKDRTTGVDYSVVRDQIRCALDRIRAAEAARQVS